MPDSRRVLIRPFLLDDEARIASISERVLRLSGEEVAQTFQTVLAEFSGRHSDIKSIFLRHYNAMKHLLPASIVLSDEQKLLMGSFFTSEYALESAALFNPSIVAAPDQSDVPAGSVRFIMSLRATGEGHISSIEFRSGTIDGEGRINFDPVGRFVTEPERVENPSYDKALFLRKLSEVEFANKYARGVMADLPDNFTLNELRSRLAMDHGSRGNLRTAEGMLLLAESNYQTRYSARQPVCERIIFPSSPSERNGIEDARFVEFHDGDEHFWAATYTAYDGRMILPQLIETEDFLSFRVSTVNGAAAQNKGMALFPRKIGDCYAMISRQDNENIFIMFSQHLHFWHERELLLMPEMPWEMVQLGNCGSPLETKEGWLLLTHGVGPMRKYCIGAVLLDLEDPRKVIGRLREPLLTPTDNEREGYVPNVVYTCGSIIHNGLLIIPYAMSDYASAVATVPMDELIAALTKAAP